MRRAAPPHPVAVAWATVEQALRFYCPDRDREVGVVGAAIASLIATTTTTNRRRRTAMPNTLHVVVTSPNGPLAAGLVEADSMDDLLATLNGRAMRDAPTYFALRDPVTGKLTLVPNGIGIIAEHG